MILDVFGVPSFHVRDVIALDAAEKLAGKCLNFFYKFPSKKKNKFFTFFLRCVSRS